MHHIIYQGNTLKVLKTLPDESVDCIVTSPPYWGLRDYGVEGQIGLEPTLEEYFEKILQITAELKRVLKKTGVMFWNHGDCYGGSGCGKGDYRNNNKRSLSNPNLYCEKPNPQLVLTPKCMALQNYRLILKMIDEQRWILRNIIIWHKPNHMPSSVKDRFTNAYEPVFMLVKSKKYWFDLDAVRVPHTSEWYKDKRMQFKKWKNGLGYVRGGNKTLGETYNPLGKNPGDVWQIPTQPFPEAHFATFPEKLVEPMIKAGCPQWICKKCGKPRVRITKIKYIVNNPQPKREETKARENKDTNYKTMQFAHGYSIHSTIGWTDCGCNAGWESGVVLDPFAGSGTTTIVAEKLGRNSIGIELNPEYVKIIKKRFKK